MHPLRPKIGVLGGLACAATVVLGAAPAMASTNHSRKPATGPEVVYGAVHGKAANASAPHIPLRLWGMVHTTDPTFVLGNGNGRRHTLRTGKGRLTVLVTGKPSHVLRANPRTCRESFTQRQTFRVVGGQSTGQFARRRAGRGTGLLRRVRPAVHARPEEGHVRLRQQPAAQPRRGGALPGHIVLTRHR